MNLFKRKPKPLNTTILRRYKSEAYGRLRFVGGWSGYWETKIDNVSYRSERVSGFQAVIGDCGNFVIDAILDRVRLRKHPDQFREDLDKLCYGGYRYVNHGGSVEQWSW